jgi:hypothetical protein
MSQPPSPYERSYSFTDNSTANPTSQQPGQKIDQELNAARTAINATISRLGEVQADDGKVRNSALNLQTIAEAVEPLLTTAPVTAVNNAGAAQVSAVNSAGTTQVANVNAAAAAGVAQIAAATTTSNAVTILGAEQSALSAANTATQNATTSTINANLAYQSYQQANSALNDAQLAELHAEGFANAAENSRTAAATEANNAINAQNAAQGYASDALASKMAALEAKGDAEAAANTAQTIVNNGAAAINAEVQPYLDAAAASATDAHNSANDALTSKTQAASSATAAASSATSASSSATAASGSATAAANSATAAANSAASINPASYAPAVHSHAIADVTGLQSALNGKLSDAPSDGTQYVRKNGAWEANSGGRVLDVNDSTAGLRVTQRGTGAAIVVEDSTTPDTTSFVVSNSGNVGIGVAVNDAPTEKLQVVGNTHADGYRLAQKATRPFAGTSSNYGIWNFGTGFVGQLRFWDGYTDQNIADHNWVYGNFPSYSWISSQNYVSGSTAGIQAAIYSAKKDYTSYPTGSYTSDYTIAISSTALSDDGRTINFYGSAYGSTYYNPGTGFYDVYYDNTQDASSILSAISSLGIPNLTFTFTDNNYAGPYYSFPSSITIQLPTIGVASTDQFVFDINNSLFKSALAYNGAAQNQVPFVSGTSVIWGQPWQAEGYINASSLGSYLASYANLANANVFTNRQIFPASTTSRASLTIPHGTAPTTPNNGDVWSTTSVVNARINGATRTLAMRETSNTFTAAAKQTVSHSTASAGLNVGPVASTVTSPVAGDVWHDSSTGVNQIFGFANGVRGAMTAVRAFVNFNGTGTVAINGVFNVSSITDNGAGDYTVNFGVAMPDANYAVIGTCSGTRSVTVNIAATDGAAPTTKTTTAVRITSGGSGAYGDQTNIAVAILR